MRAFRCTNVCFYPGAIITGIINFEMLILLEGKMTLHTCPKKETLIVG
jgi:hypothetical protein